MCSIILYYTQNKIEYKKDDFSILLISSIILLSSPFRTDGYFGLIQILAFKILIVFFYFLHLKTKEKKYIIPTIFFSCFKSFIVANLRFCLNHNFFYFLDKNNLISFKNFK